ncbi:MAG TPA: ester cyclase [Bryobacteraceae bacterium]|nr:ester cyclase [Bryobacteraceae bacterium]
MSAFENKLLIRRFVEEVINTGDTARLHEFVAADYRERDDMSGRIAGIEGCRAHILAVRTTYPDLHLTIDEQIAEGDLVATCVSMTGTHCGEWPPGAKPTNKRVRMKAVNIDRVREGLIVEHGGAANEMLAFMEIGLIRF